MKGLFKMVLLAACVSTMVACGGPTDKERQVVAELTSDMRTDCIGRMLIDVPKSFEWSYAPHLTLYYGKDEDFRTVDVQVVAVKVDQEQFKAHVDRRVLRIAADINSESSTSVLLSDSDEGGVRFIKRYENNEIVDAITHEAHFLVSGVQLFIKGDSYPGDGEAMPVRLKRLVTQIHKPEGPMKQWGPGFCMGPLLINADHDYEVMTISAGDNRNGHEDIVLEFYTNSMERLDESETLSDRVDMAFSMMGGAMKLLKKGRVSLMGQKAEQALARYKELEGRHSLSFGLWLMRSQPSLESPSLTLELQTRGEISQDPSGPDPLFYGVDSSPSSDKLPIKMDASLSDEEAIGLWDAILKSIRPRPGAV